MSLERYSKIVEWARKRYTRGGILVLAEAGGVPSVYSRIEAAAWNKYAASEPAVRVESEIVDGYARPSKIFPLPPGAFSWWDNPCPRRGW